MFAYLVGIWHERWTYGPRSCGMSAWCSRNVHVIHIMADQEQCGTTVPVQDGTGMEICNANCACTNHWIVVPLSGEFSHISLTIPCSLFLLNLDCYWRNHDAWTLTVINASPLPGFDESSWNSLLAFLNSSRLVLRINTFREVWYFSPPLIFSNLDLENPQNYTPRFRSWSQASAQQVFYSHTHS